MMKFKWICFCLGITINAIHTMSFFHLSETVRAPRSRKRNVEFVKWNDDNNYLWVQTHSAHWIYNRSILQWTHPMCSFFNHLGPFATLFTSAIHAMWNMQNARLLLEYDNIFTSLHITPRTKLLSHTGHLLFILASTITYFVCCFATLCAISRSSRSPLLRRTFLYYAMYTRCPFCLPVAHDCYPLW